MINQIRIDNFKSLVDFELRLTSFTCLVGLNGAGKSTLLQAMDFISQQMRGELDEWLALRQWDKRDIGSRLTPKQNIDFYVQVEIHDHGLVEWSASFNRHSLRCTSEEVFHDGVRLLKVEDAECWLVNGSDAGLRTRKMDIVFEYQGSILSQLKPKQLGDVLQALREQVVNIRSLDLLSPEFLRQRTRESAGHLGLGGQKLSAYLHEQGSEARQHLLNQLKHVYPQLASIETRSLRSGWKHLDISEQFAGKFLKTPARHTNDGLLRLMAVLSQLSSDEHFLLFDEIENGINPELVEFLVDALVESEHQVMVTTHSPVILNFLEDDVAKKGVIYLYKNAYGATQAIHLFSIPSLAEKLSIMGPGEAFIDTQLTELESEIKTLSQQEGMDAAATER
ncbi:AAA family ATPase [Halomonas sp. M4R5S39]|uniref:AAA family ATPase n=1 Tax=Halomonas kalidii TaxID=3043293 RepID=A0ABT6VNZ6_9GAMM|nr:ATP-binding protein [Halomonas kalidii]MDI5934668.1 AAA family ATPase [Halomonas kalidii]MDI5986012.1 AAA family ATPase [Halomonas kalidii]